MRINVRQVLGNIQLNKHKRFPSKSDPQFQEPFIFPNISPRFEFTIPATVFTIGSCFARNIEEELERYDITLPTRKFAVPKTEYPRRPNGLLNEFTPGTMHQRIMSAIHHKYLSDETLISRSDGFIDLTLVGDIGVTFERAKQRRKEIDSVYNHLLTSDIVILTLGYVEAWYDLHTRLYLNRMPPIECLHKQSERFELRQLDVNESYQLLSEAIKALIEANSKLRILLTVSPVPIDTTFTDMNVVVANTYSKSVLRVCAATICNTFPQVDYFPSYEIALSGGTNATIDDNIHIKSDLVKQITALMIKKYVKI